jgi:hypothetical protein
MFDINFQFILNLFHNFLMIILHYFILIEFILHEKKLTLIDYDNIIDFNIIIDLNHLIIIVLIFIVNFIYIYFPPNYVFIIIFLIIYETILRIFYSLINTFNPSNF